MKYLTGFMYVWCAVRFFSFVLYYNTTQYYARNRIVIIIFCFCFFFFPIALFYLFVLLYYIVAPAITQKGRRTFYVNASVTTSCSPSKKVFRSIRSTPKETTSPATSLSYPEPNNRRENKRFRVHNDVHWQPQSLTAIFDRAE